MHVTSRRKLAFSFVQAALITVTVLGLMVGAAAAAELNLRSVAEHVVNTLVEPLQLSAAGQIDAAGLNTGEQEPADEASSIGHPGDPAESGRAVVSDAFVPRGPAEVSDRNGANPRAQGGQRGRTSPPPVSRAPDNNPQGNRDNPPGNGGQRGGQSQGGDHNQRGSTDGQNLIHRGQSSDDRRDESNSSDNQGDSDQKDRTHPTANWLNGDEPDGSNANTTGDQSRGSHDPDSVGSSEWRLSQEGAADKGGSK